MQSSNLHPFPYSPRGIGRRYRQEVESGDTGARKVIRDAKREARRADRRDARSVILAGLSEEVDA